MAGGRTGELTFNPPHYAFGHFSRFIRRGARRIACPNPTDHPQIFQLWVEGQALRYSSPANGIITVVL